MPEMRSLGRLFVGYISLRKDAPRVHTAPMTEIDYPFRSGPAVHIRIWAEHGIGIGIWTEYLNEDAAMLRALGAREEKLFDQHGALLPNYGRADDDAFWRSLDRENRRAHLTRPQTRPEPGGGDDDAGDAGPGEGA